MNKLFARNGLTLDETYIGGRPDFHITPGDAASTGLIPWGRPSVTFLHRGENAAHRLIMADDQHGTARLWAVVRVPDWTPHPLTGQPSSTDVLVYVGYTGFDYTDRAVEAFAHAVRLAEALYETPGSTCEGLRATVEAFAADRFNSTPAY